MEDEEDLKWEQIFDLQREREREVIERWRAEGKLGLLTLPDHGWAYHKVLLGGSAGFASLTRRY